MSSGKRRPSKRQAAQDVLDAAKKVRLDECGALIQAALTLYNCALVAEPRFVRLPSAGNAFTISTELKLEPLPDPEP